MGSPNLRLSLLASIGALLSSTAFGQGQPAGNAPIKICQWSEIRAAVVRDTLYIDGGQMFLEESNFDPWTVYGQPSTMYYLNYTVGFQLSDNLTTLFTNLPQGPSQKDSYYNGYMFADDFQLWTYGGLANAPVGSGESPPSDFIFGYEFFADDESIVRPVLGPAGTGATLTSPVTRYLTNGAGANVPGERLGFYFSGMTNADAAAYDVGKATTPAATLLQIDMTNEAVPHWNSSTLPDYITPRADAALVWVPVGTNGTLLAIGGVVNPEELFADSLNQTQVTESMNTSPSFMTSIAVYDIANGAWYQQNISGSEHPGQLTQFCSVMVSETNPSSYQIYIHGGYNGLLGTGASDTASAPNDDVWVLSVPSFTWTKVSSGNGKGRSGHFCTAPYPDQMFVIGGYGGYEVPCVDSIIKVFNLHTLKWQTGYDPSTWSDYKIPGPVASAIAAHPTASWSDPGLATLFGTKYTKNMTIFYPYTNHPIQHSHTAAVAGGAAAGGVCLIVLVLAILWYRHKHNKKPLGPGDSEVQPYEQVSRWRHGVAKTDPSVTTTEIGDAPDINQNTGGYYKPAAAEVAGDQGFHRHSATSPRPGGFAEAGGGTRRISGGPMISPHSPRSPNSGTLDAQEVEGEERYEMEVMQSQRGSGDMGARHRFRDHPFYPLSVSDGDGRSQASGPSYSGPSHSHSQVSRGEPSRGVPSPYLMARPGSGVIDDVELPASPIRPTHHQHTRNISSISSPGLPQVSPTLEHPHANPVATPPTHTRTTSEDELDALEAFHLGTARPTHKRNLSSMSSGINQLPTPDEELTEEEKHRQSTLLAKLPSPVGTTPITEERNPLLGAGGGNGEQRTAVGDNAGTTTMGEDLYSPSSYSQGSTLVTSARSPVSRKPVGQGLGIERGFSGHEGIGEERQTL